MIEVVTHCWSGSAVPIYHKLLNFQLSSIFAASTKSDVTVRVFYCEEDELTTSVVRYFELLYQRRRGLRLNASPLSKGELFRRGIGRNRAAFETKADVVWFTDCDHLFYGHALDQALMGCLRSKDNLVYPEAILRQQFHWTGDALLEALDPCPSFNVPECDSRGAGFRVFRPGKAIGGLQIVKGDWLRENGYCSGKHLRIPDPSKEFQKCTCDLQIRKMTTSSEIVVPNVYRLRHSRAGRDGGTIDHGSRT